MMLTPFQIEALRTAVEQSRLSEITKGELLGVLDREIILLLPATTKAEAKIIERPWWEEQEICS